MAVKFQDYYKTLGLKRDASPEQIQRAYRRLARQYHPDVNKSADAAEKFKQINEAYEVLKDPQKRQRYDQLGADWKAGQEFAPPPGFDNMHFEFRGSPGGNFRFSPSGFSDFFDTFFGGSGRNSRGFGGFSSGDGGGRGAPAGPTADVRAEVAITLEEAISGTTCQLRVQDSSGQTSTLDLKIPAGVSNGSKIRLKGQGIQLNVKVSPHTVFKLDGRDILTDVRVAPWEAVLGAKVPVRTPTGEVALTIAPGSQSAQKLRIRGKGLPAHGKQPAGDFFAQIKVVVPKLLSDQDRQLYEQLRDRSTFNPRDCGEQGAKDEERRTRSDGT